MSEMVERFWALVDKRSDDDCWPWLGRMQANRSGALYGYFGRGTRAPRLAWELANGRKIPAGMVIRHKCDNPSCVNPSHLETGTQKDNVRDRYDRGRSNHCIGSAHGNHKLTEEQVRDLRGKLAGGMSSRQAAKHFGISQFGVLWAAKVGWRHV